MYDPELGLLSKNLRQGEPNYAKADFRIDLINYRNVEEKADMDALALLARTAREESLPLYVETALARRDDLGEARLQDEAFEIAREFELL